MENSSPERKATYIHFGTNSFDPNLFKPIKDIFWIKPQGGLWASELHCKNGWKDWCIENNYRTCELTTENAFTFKLKKYSRVLSINSVEDLRPLPKYNFEAPLVTKISPIFLKFEELAKLYDVIEFSLSKDPNLYWALYGWDCDCILVMNKDVVVQ